MLPNIGTLLTTLKAESAELHQQLAEIVRLLTEIREELRDGNYVKRPF